MGWSHTGHGDDVIGDAAADVVEAMFARRRKEGRAKPSREDLDTALGRLLQGRSVETDLGRAVGGTLEEIRTLYRQGLDRDPRDSEVWATFDFVIGPDPERYLQPG